MKNGDGAADLKPIAHLYKSQVISFRRPSRPARRDLRPPADHRHLVAAAEPGGVLFLRAHKVMDVCMHGLERLQRGDDGGKAGLQRR